MNKGTVKHFYLPLLYFLVFITKLQNPERNLTPLRCSLFHVHRPDTHSPSASTRSEDPANGKHINSRAEAIWRAGDSTRIQDLGIQTLSSFLQAAAAKRSHLWLISVAWVVRAVYCSPQPKEHPAKAAPAATWHCLGTGTQIRLHPTARDHPRGCQGEDISCLSRGITASPAALSSFQHLSDVSVLPPCSALGPRGNVFPFLNRFREECAKEELHHSDAEGRSADYIYPHRICKSEHKSTCAFSFNWKPRNNNTAWWRNWILAFANTFAIPDFAT